VLGFVLQQADRYVVTCHSKEQTDTGTVRKTFRRRQYAGTALIQDSGNSLKLYLSITKFQFHLALRTCAFETSNDCFIFHEYLPNTINIEITINTYN
jgi:hypothetical protein